MLEGSTVESRFKKARFKKESRFKKDCWYNRFFSKNKDFLAILKKFSGFFQKKFQVLASYSTIQFILFKKIV